jgi:hypothetical protein
MSLPTDNQTIPQTPDSYDAHIIPAETAARKDREGEEYKQVPENAESPESIDTTGGYTVDQEGLANNYAVEPEMYFETPGDVPGVRSRSAATEQYTLVDIFPSPTAAEKIVVKMKAAGLDTHKISIIGQDYQDTEHVHGALNWSRIDQTGGLAVVLEGLGIATSEAARFETETAAGQFIVLVMGSEADITQANQILHAIGHKTRAEIAL